MALRINDFYQSGDGGCWASALDRAALAAMWNGHSISFGPGVHEFKRKPLPFARGVNLVGDGAVGASFEQGTVLMASYDGDEFLVWDGAHVYQGCGGGISSIVLSTSASCKTAVKLTGTSLEKRAGWWRADRVLIYTQKPFDTGLFIDGSKIIPPAVDQGAAGIRDIWITDSTFTSCNTANIFAIGAYHLFISCMQTMQGNSPGLNRCVFEDCCDVNINGSLWSDVVVKRTKNIVVSGYVSNMEIAQSNGTFTGVAGATKIDGSFKVFG